MTQTELPRTGWPPLQFNGEQLSSREGDYYRIRIFETDDHGFAGSIQYKEHGLTLAWAHLSRNWVAIRTWLCQHQPMDYVGDHCGQQPASEFSILCPQIVREMELIYDSDTRKNRAARRRIIKGVNQI